MENKLKIRCANLTTLCIFILYHTTLCCVFKVASVSWMKLMITISVHLLQWIENMRVCEIEKWKKNKNRLRNVHKTHHRTSSQRKLNVLGYVKGQLKWTPLPLKRFNFYHIHEILHRRKCVYQLKNRNKNIKIVTMNGCAKWCRRKRNKKLIIKNETKLANTLYFMYIKTYKHDSLLVSVQYLNES